LEGRKATSGKIEVKIRVRDPLVNKEVKIIEQKWLIIDNFMTANVNYLFY
jgi:coiled-coil and C2 domain-containing protein 1